MQYKIVRKQINLVGNRPKFVDFECMATERLFRIQFYDTKYQPLEEGVARCIEAHKKEHPDSYTIYVYTGYHASTKHAYVFVSNEECEILGQSIEENIK